MSDYLAVFLGGPADGEEVVRQDAPKHIELPVLGPLRTPESAIRPSPFVEIGLASYERLGEAKGHRITYAHMPGVVPGRG